MKHFIIYLLLFSPVFLFAQIKDEVEDASEYEYMMIEGDSVAQTVVNLNPIYIIGNLKFPNKEDRIKYLILRRKTLKVYPYAKLASEGLTLSSNAYGSVFYMTTAFHGLHVTGGLIAFLIVLVRVFRAQNFGHRQATTAIVVSYYWHFVDIVWIALFSAIYLVK